MSTSDASTMEDPSFQAIIEQSIAGVYVLQDERFVYCNDTWAGFMGMTRQEMIGLTLRDVVPADFIDQSLSIYRRRISGEIPSVRYVTPALHKAGHRVHLEVHGTRLAYRGRPAVVGVGIDVSERVARDEELRRARHDLQELTAHINRDREAQRARFAREIHDVLGGLLASIKMDIKRINRRVQDPELLQMVAGLTAVTQEAIQTVREMSEELRPSGLDHLGLRPTMERELARFGARHAIDCSLDCAELSFALASERATSIYRVLQEGLQLLLLRGAPARRLAVRLQQHDSELLLELRSDGPGLAGAARDLLGMKERARELGGALEAQALAEGGSCLRLQVPVSA